MGVHICFGIRVSESWCSVFVAQAQSEQGMHDDIVFKCTDRRYIKCTQCAFKSRTISNVSARFLSSGEYKYVESTFAEILRE